MARMSPSPSLPLSLALSLALALTLTSLVHGQVYSPAGSKSQFGSASAESVNAVAHDAASLTSNYSYAVGTTGGALSGSALGGTDIFVVKVNSTNMHQWIRQLGSASDDVANAVAVNASSVYVAGSSAGNLYAAKLAATTGATVWEFQIASVAAEATAVAAAADGYIYIAGHTTGALTGSPNAGGQDIALVKVDGVSRVESWRLQTGTSADDTVGGMVLASGSGSGSGSVYMAGTTAGTLVGATTAGGTDAFVIKVTGSTGAVAWRFQFGSSANDAATSVASYSGGDNGVVVAGYTHGGLSGASAGNEDVFVVRVSSTGTQLWKLQFGTTAFDRATGVALDSSGNAWLVGTSNGTLADTATPAGDLFVSKVNSTGTRLWTVTLGTAGAETASGIAIGHPAGLPTTTTTSLLLGGSTTGAFANYSSAGSTDAVLVRVNECSAGSYCASASAAMQTVCPAGAYCVVGSTAAVLCPVNTSNHITGASTRAECFACATGESSFAGARFCGVFVQFGTSSRDSGSAILLTPGGGVTTVSNFGTATGPAALLRGYDVNNAPTFSYIAATPKFDSGYGLQVDAVGNSYMMGFTRGNMFRTAEKIDFYAVKVNSTGHLQWGYQNGSSLTDVCYGGVLDSAGNLYLHISTDGDLDGKSDPMNTFDIVLLKLNPAGKQEWAVQSSTSGGEEGRGIGIDSNEQIITSGFTSGSWPGYTNAGGRFDIFVRKQRSNGSTVWVYQVGSGGDDRAYSLVVDSSDSIYVVGYTDGSLFATNVGGRDVFAFKLSTDKQVLWTYQRGSSKHDEVIGVTLDSSRNLYMCGRTKGSLYGPGPGSDIKSKILVISLDPNGKERWIYQFGVANKHDKSSSLVLDSAGHLYINGETAGVIAAPEAGGSDVLLVRLNICTAGTYCPLDRSSIGGCPQGSYCPTGSVAPRACPAGKFTGTVNQTKPADCTDCGVGMWCADGVRAACTAGSVSAALQASSAAACSVCSAGTYADTTRTSCTSCEAGSWCASGVKTACVAGTENANTNSVAIGACTSCGVGQISAAGALSCSVCSAGTYANAMQTSCANCEAGSWCASGVKTACVAGTENTNMNSVAIGACTNCGAGQISTPGASCAACANGKYADAMRTSCVNCGAGNFCARGLKSTCLTVSTSACQSTQYLSVNCTGPASFDGGQCLSCTTCARVLSACTATSDRVCDTSSSSSSSSGKVLGINESVFAGSLVGIGFVLLLVLGACLMQRSRQRQRQREKSMNTVRLDPQGTSSSSAVRMPRDDGEIEMRSTIALDPPPHNV